MQLIDFGWNSFFEEHYNNLNLKQFSPARVMRENKSNYILMSEAGELNAQVTGKMLYEQNEQQLPVVGDWVLIQPFDDAGAIIHEVLPRQSSFERKVAGEETKAQVVAANVDTVFLVNGLDDDFNIRRIERYINTVYDSGASPVIVLNKADVCNDIASYKAEIESIAFGIPVFIISALNGDGLDEMQAYLKKGNTVALIGSSGVGKSTIINHFLGFEKMKVRDVSDEKSKGRHTTTHRELIRLPSGALFMDTPGMRELQLWGDESTLKKTFEDIEQFAGLCKFKDCQHNNEPGCKVLEAIEAAELVEERLSSFRKLQRELEHLASRKDQYGRHLLKQKGKKFASMIRQKYKIDRQMGRKK